MKAGFYTSDITPAVGMEKPGGYGKVYIERIHDPLKVRASVFEDNNTTIALVGIDTCVLGSPTMVNHVRSEVERRCGIPGTHILMGTSHTHSGGPLWELSFSNFADAPELVKQLVYDYSTAGNETYSQWVTGQLITAICEAYHRRQDALIAIGSGHEDKIAFNRRFRMRNGRVYTHPGKGNPDIIGPAGPTDPEVGVVSAWTPQGDLLGCVVNFSCHCTIFGSAVSADYVYYLEKTIQGGMASDAPVVFLNGACGDVTQVDNQALRESEFGDKWCRYVGTRLGAEVLKVMVSTQPGDHSPIAAATKALRLKRRKPSEESVKRSREIVEEGLRSGKRDTEWTFAKERVVLDYMVHKDPEVDTEVQAIQMGQTLFIANAAEFFCGLGLAIKKGSPFAQTYVVELANGCIGYVPTRDAFAPDGGGYETVLNTYSNLETDACDTLVAASLELARALEPGTAPPPIGVASLEQPQVPASEWSYGVLGPDLE